ncbi:MAG: 16S rRNA (guanine(966)-N(2))-methyltransferase RsmD [Chlamydiota bacterium]|nr:16S rRNA (guanine(966)-N(2))-methyltransferase RsmD [Chlamydiota bacterium]
MVRIICGLAKGRKISIPKGLEVRPTLDRVKESIFNILFHRFDGARVLDLYAGSGNLGLEALSRGASEVVFVEKDKCNTVIIQKNLDLLGFKNANICPLPVFTYLRRFTARPFDIIFVDPPYSCYEHIKFVEELFSVILDRSALVQNGMIVIEHPSRNHFDFPMEMLQLYKHRCYGQTAVSFVEFVGS